MTRKFRSGPAWIPGKIIQQLDPLTTFLMLPRVAYGNVLWRWWSCRNRDYSGGGCYSQEAYKTKPGTTCSRKRSSVGRENDPVLESEPHYLRNCHLQHRILHMKLKHQVNTTINFPFPRNIQLEHAPGQTKNLVTEECNNLTLWFYLFTLLLVLNSYYIDCVVISCDCVVHVMWYL